MSSRGTSTSTSSRLNILSLNSKNNKKFTFKPHTDMTDTYSIVLPASIGSTDSTDKVLKIDSSANSSAICDWTYPGVEQHSTSTSPITFKVTVATKTSAHRYDGQGFSYGYLIDGKHSPYIDMIPGKTYRFDQSHSSNNTHPIKFYTTATKDSGTEYTTGVTTSNATIGTTGAYVEIVVSDSTPALLFYQCQNHVLMGNQIQVKGVGGSGGGGGSGLTNWTEDTNGHIIPNTNAAYDLGSAEKKVRHLYLSDNSIYMGTNNTQISLDSDNDITIKVGDNNATKLIKADSSGKVPSSKLSIVPAASSGNLTSLQIGDTTYNIPSGGSGTSLPSQTGNADKFLKTDGSSLTWATPSGGSGSGSSDFKGLSDTPNTMTAADAGKAVRVNSAGNALEYTNPDAFPSVTLPNDKQIQHKTLTGTQDISVTAGSLADFNDGTGALEVTLTPSISSAQVLVTVNANIGLSNDTLLTLEKTVGTNAPTIVGNDHPFISNQCNFKFIDTLTDQTAVTYKTKVKNPSSQNVNVILEPTSTLFHEDSFKFMWQAGKNTTVINQYSVTAVGTTMSVSEDSDGYKYVSPQAGNYFKITDQAARLASDQKYLTLAFVIDFNGNNTVGNFIFHQEGEDSNSDGNARNHNFFINRSNGNYPNKLAYDNYEPGGGGYNSSSAISTGRNIVVVTLASTVVKIYENGVNTISDTKTAGDTYNGDTPDKILIGGSRYVNTHSFQGDKLYSVAVWQRALSACEVKLLTLDLLANGTPPPPPVSIMTAEQISSARSFTTANPLLANPSTADKGKIVTVNSTGDDLEYGANFRELAFGQTIIRTAKKIEGLAERWLDLSSHNTSISDFNTDVSVNVAQGSRVKINCLTGVSTVGGNGIISFRLGKKVDGNVVWGSTNGVLTTRNDYQTDPKGDNEYSNKSENIGQNRIECWDFIHNEAEHILYCVEPHFVDTNPTNGLSGTHTVTYFLRVRCEYPNSGMTNDDFFINQDGSGVTTNQDRETCATILSVEELGSGAITSFTQEQALAGAGGTAAFTAYGSNTLSADYGTAKLHDNNADDINQDNAGIYSTNTNGIVSISYEFTIPQVVTKYRIWPRHWDNDEIRKRNIRTWELRAATDKATYDAGGTGAYTVLDSQSLPGGDDVNSANSAWRCDLARSQLSSTNSLASDNLNVANMYNLSTIGSYKYYLLYITDNFGGTYHQLAEWALYGLSLIHI